ncbi:MAG: alpha/beta hydrolase [Planctomycetaceae bacterium]
MTVRRFRSRLTLSMVAATFLAAFSGPTAAAQKTSPKRRGAVVSKNLVAGDGFPIAITYYESTAGQESPAVILLHMKGSNRLVWKGPKGLAAQLQARGYAVVAVDLRKHGESRVRGAAAPGRKRKKAADLRPVDYKAMVAYDLVAVKKFLLREHQAKKLNIRKTAIIATEMSAPIAAIFARRDWLKKPYPDGPTPATSTPRGQDIRALVLLSPVEAMPGLNAGTSYRALASPLFRVAVLVGYGKNDALDRGGKTAKRVFEKFASVAGNKKRMYLKAYPTKSRGTDMLGRRTNLERNIRNFLNLHLKKLPDQWRDRRSKLTTDD